jgi:lambda family phage portal protein
MNLLDRVIAGLSPARGLQRARARTALGALMNYNAATSTSRGSGLRKSASDADGATARRARLAYAARDLVRNTPFATRAQQVIANNVVGDGIIWKVNASAKAAKIATQKLLKAHFDTVAIDADGRQNLYGLQRLAMTCIVESGEVLIRRRRRERRDGLPLPFQIQILEPDFIDEAKQNLTAKGPTIRDGIEYDAIGRRTAYWLFEEHPGAARKLTASLQSRRVPASEILHLYRQDRPGQMRGVSWFAPIALRLMDLDDYDDAQLMRQKIAACFAAFTVSMSDGGAVPGSASADADPQGLSSIMPGRIQRLGPDEDIKFSSPPGVEGYDIFTRGVLRGAAAAMGITYEALTGDLTGVNFSSARMGRMEMDRNVSSWQWLMMVPQFLQPLAAWTMEAMEMQAGQRRARDLSIDWTPPTRILVDPAREIPAMIEKIKGGLASWQQVVRELGYDPEDMLDEHSEDRKRFTDLGLSFTSFLQAAGIQDPAAQPPAPQAPAPKPQDDDTDDDTGAAPGTT